VQRQRTALDLIGQGQAPPLAVVGAGQALDDLGCIARQDVVEAAGEVRVVGRARLDTLKRCARVAPQEVAAEALVHEARNSTARLRRDIDAEVIALKAHDTHLIDRDPFLHCDDRVFHAIRFASARPARGVHGRVVGRGF